MKNKNKKVLKHNAIYIGSDLHPFVRLLEVVATFVLTSKNWLSKRKSKKYYSSQDFKHWGGSSKPVSSSFEPIITWVGQSTFLIQIGCVNILTDPVFCGLTFVYPRNFKPGIAFEDLPKIDYVILSHNHRDHMEHKTLLKLRDKFNPTFLVPLKNKKWFDKRNFEKVIEKDWWEENSFYVNNSKNEKIKITCLPAIHWSGEMPWNINKVLWASWMIEFAGSKIYFAGDSAYARHFKEISEKFKNIDFALMPIGPNEPRKTVKISHINARESVQAFIDLNAQNFIPMHWGTFRIGGDKFDEPIAKLKKHWNAKSDLLKNKDLHIVKFGQQVDSKFHTQSSRSLYLNTD